MKKIALGIVYDGSCYYGWQRQKKFNSIQECLEKALKKIAEKNIKIFCAGRTDTGVHATGQVVHFETKYNRKKLSWIRGVNYHLPEDISVHWMSEVKEEFHARFSATARSYRYIIFNHPYRSALFKKGIMHFSHKLDAEYMHHAAQSLLGMKDFTSFRASHCPSCTPLRDVQYVKVKRNGEYIIIDIKANSFLYHMVRNIVGNLLEVGCGNKKESWISELLKLKDRNLGAATAPAEGLYLVSIDYPQHLFLQN